MSDDDRAASFRFFIQMAINIFLCNQAQSMIGKRMAKEQNPSVKSYLIFIIFAIILFTVNQTSYMFFKDYNLYEKLGVARSLSIGELK